MLLFGAYVEFLVIEHSQNDHSRAFVDKMTPSIWRRDGDMRKSSACYLPQAGRGFESPGQTRVDTIRSDVAMETRKNSSYAFQA